MGKVLSHYVKRPFANYNIESRAHKYIEKQIPKAAPRHPSTVHLIEKHLSENPHLSDVVTKKNEKLVGNLKDVYVTATTIDSVKASTTNERPLPGRQQQWSIESKSVEEVAKTRPVPEGRITLMQTTDLLSEFHELDAETVDLKDAVTKYRLNEDVIRDILKYVSTLQLYVPSADKSIPLDNQMPPVFTKPEKRKKLD